MKLALCCFCLFVLACIHDAILLHVYDKREVTFCFWDAEKLTNGTVHLGAASVVATLGHHCKVIFVHSMF